MSQVFSIRFGGIMVAFGGRMVEEEGWFWTIPSIGFIVFIKFDFQVDLHENNNNSIIQLIHRSEQLNPTQTHRITLLSPIQQSQLDFNAGGTYACNYFIVLSGGLYTVVILLVQLKNKGLNQIRMANIINLQHKSPTLSHIKTVTQILPFKHGLIIMVGHSPESLKKLQIIYEIFDSKQWKSIKSGIISNFGVIFLTQYVLYDKVGSYLALVNSSGSKKIIRQGFGTGESKTVVGQVRFQKFEQQARSQSYVIYYSPIYKKIYLLQHLKFSQEEHQIFLRGYQDDKEIINYRIIALEQQIPQIVCSPKRIIFICGTEITVYKDRLQPQYFAISNMQQFDILAFYNDFILQFKEDSSIFTMSLNGAIRPLLDEPVASYWFAHDKLYFLVNRAGERKSIIKIYKVKDKEMVQQCQLTSQYASRLVYVNSEEIIVGVK